MIRRFTAALAILIAGAAWFLTAALFSAAPAQAHVVPATTIELAVHEANITARLLLPAEDLAIASGIDLPDAGDLGESGAVADVPAVNAYVQQHFKVNSASGAAWSVDVTGATITTAEQGGTGAFGAVTAIATLTPPAGADLREFTLVYDAIIHQVVSADIYVNLMSDWAAGQFEGTRNLGVIALDTVSGSVTPLPVSLDDGNAWVGFVGMVKLGMSHIAAGTDHQLFLLTLLLPAPLVAAGSRWGSVATGRGALRAIGRITIAFTIGHSVTLLLGALGLPVPLAPIEALIAGSILVAAVHAVRPIFAGREALVALGFGLVHGMAFSATLAEMNLGGGQLLLSLLGFNLGIEVLQLLVVLAVLPPLVVMARTRAYRWVRGAAATLAAIAAVGWLLARLGVVNPVAVWADALGSASPYVVLGLWAAAGVGLVRHAVRRRSPGENASMTIDM